jgi:CubicO group peptidase (beta-lactamase class C family)
VFDALPRSMQQEGGRYRRFSKLTLKDVLAMSALDAQVTPHENTPAAHDRLHRFLAASNRFKFALDQDLLARPGIDFQYTDITPMIASGLIENATGQSLLDFANSVLFGPMEFKNVEWMHQDVSGYDNAAYGLRLRPIDMQKFGVLYLAGGCWAGRQLVSSVWVKTSLEPWIRSRVESPRPNYGWYWWLDTFAGGWTAHTANGWKGQRISIFPQLDAVVTMTADIEDGKEDAVYRQLVERFIIPAFTIPMPDEAGTARLNERLQASLEEVRRGPSRIASDTEPRMVPSANAMEAHHAFRP